MKITAIVCTFAVAIALSMLSGTTTAQAADDQLSIGSAKVTQLKDDDKVQEPKDKPKKSKKNDDKDGDPDDGNSGGGNDDSEVPNDGATAD